MKITKLYVEASFTKNIGNYQSFKPTAGVEVSIGENDSIEEAYEKAWKLVGDEVEKQLSLFDQTNNKKVF